MNASLTWNASDSGVSVQLFAKNIGNVYYFSSASVSAGNDIYLPGEPRTYGVTLRLRTR